MSSSTAGDFTSPQPNNAATTSTTSRRQIGASNDKDWKLHHSNQKSTDPSDMTKHLYDIAREYDDTLDPMERCMHAESVDGMASDARKRWTSIMAQQLSLSSHNEDPEKQFYENLAEFRGLLDAVESAMLKHFHTKDVMHTFHRAVNDLEIYIESQQRHHD